MRLLYCIVFCGVSGPVVGEEAFALKSTVETGWTSNATETPDGPSDLFVQHSHEMSLSGTLGALSLRGTLLLDQTRFSSILAEDDLSVAAGVEAGLVVGGGMALRVGYALTRDWTGEGLVVPDALIGIAGGGTTHEALAELTIVGTDQQVSVAVNGSWVYPTDSIISGLPFVLPPVRLDPQVFTIGTAINWEKAVTENVAVLGRFLGNFSNVPEFDQFQYLRLPGTAATVAAGARFKGNGIAAEVLAGGTLVWPMIDPGLRETMPYLAAEAEWTPDPRWTFTAKAAQRAEIADPLDPVASSVKEAEISVRYGVTDALSLTAAMARSDEAGIFDRTQERRVSTASLRLDYAVSEQVGLSLSTMRKWVDEPGAPYEVDRVSVAVNALF